MFHAIWKFSLTSFLCCHIKMSLNISCIRDWLAYQRSEKKPSSEAPHYLYDILHHQTRKSHPLFSLRYTEEKSSRPLDPNSFAHEQLLAIYYMHLILTVIPGSSKRVESIATLPWRHNLQGYTTKRKEGCGIETSWTLTLWTLPVDSARELFFSSNNLFWLLNLLNVEEFVSFLHFKFKLSTSLWY